MEPKEFQDMIYKKANKDYGICPPPMEAQFGLNILIDHFLGEEWHVAMPIGVEQVNTEAINEILKRFPTKMSLGERLSHFFKAKGA